MSEDFSRSLRSLRRHDRRGSTLLLATGIALFGAWTAWMASAKVPLYVVSSATRIEVATSGFPVESPVEGRVAAVHIQLGMVVEEGQALLELESSAERLQLQETRSRQASLEGELAALRSVILADESALVAFRKSTSARLAEARLRQKEAESAVAFARDEAGRAALLHDGGALSDSELERLTGVATSRTLTAQAMAAQTARLETEDHTSDADRQTQLSERRREESRISGELAMTKVTAARFELEIERRTIRAPIRGQIGDLAASTVGTVVRPGPRLATVIPSTDLRIVAHVPARDALGRVREGQRAKLDLDAFPFIQYGSILAQVVGVGSETNEGMIRVELGVTHAPASLLPLQHGESGRIEIEVERVTPAVLVLRTAGGLLDT